MKQLSYLLLILILLLSGCCKDDENPGWVKHSGNPVMLPGTIFDWDREFVGLGSVIYHSNKYHMWYSGGRNYSWKIGHATSPDGIIWTKDVNNPVLDKGTTGSWDAGMAHSPIVMVVNNTFHMWYTGWKGVTVDFDNQIGHATSPDGITWTKDPNNPVLPTGPDGAWDHGWVVAYSILYDSNKYHMWYGAWDGINFTYPRIGHATSPDGLTWTKDPANPVLVADAGSWDFPRVDFPSVIFDGTTYHMWYSGGSMYSWKIGYATSADGSSWTKYSSNPVLGTGKEGSWDSRSVATMSVLDNSGKFMMWYWGSKTENSASIGYAEVPHN